MDDIHNSFGVETYEYLELWIIKMNIKYVHILEIYILLYK